MTTTTKCIITRYDETITEPPYETIPIDEIEVEKPENDYLGEKFYKILRQSCEAKGYFMKFYTLPDDKEKYDYEIVVY